MDAPRDVRSSASFAPAAHVAKRARTDESGSAAVPTESRDRQGREGRWTTRGRTAPEVPLPRRARTGARAPRRAKTEARAPRRADARVSVDADGADVAGVRITSDFVRGEARLLVPERGSAPRPRRIMMSGPRREKTCFSAGLLRRPRRRGSHSAPPIDDGRGLSLASFRIRHRAPVRGVLLLRRLLPGGAPTPRVARGLSPARASPSSRAKPSARPRRNARN